MKSIRLALAATILIVAACASGAGVWSGDVATLDRASLRQEMEKTLRADQWEVIDRTDTVVAVKRGAGGHRTFAAITFQDAGKGSSYQLVGKSDHVVNWLSFGILGLAMKSKAAHTCTNLVETFNREHPANK